jgi:excisionase family DNA binding protein
MAFFISRREGNMDRQSYFLTVQEIAAFLKVPVSWVYQRTRQSGDGGIPHIKLGKYCRFNQDQVMQWIKKNSVEKQG